MFAYGRSSKVSMCAARTIPIPRLFIGTRLVPSAEYASLGVDAIVDLEDWDIAWNPPVPETCMSPRSSPRSSAAATAFWFTARKGCRSGLVIATALVEMGWTPSPAIELVRERRGPTEDDFRALPIAAFDGLDQLATDARSRWDRATDSS